MRGLANLLIIAGRLLVRHYRCQNSGGSFDMLALLTQAPQTAVPVPYRALPTACAWLRKDTSAIPPTMLPSSVGVKN